MFNFFVRLAHIAYNEQQYDKGILFLHINTTYGSINMKLNSHIKLCKCFFFAKTILCFFFYLITPTTERYVTKQTRFQTNTYANAGVIDLYG